MTSRYTAKNGDKIALLRDPESKLSQCVVKLLEDVETALFTPEELQALKEKYGEQEVESSSSEGTEEMAADELELNQAVKSTLKRTQSKLKGGGPFSAFTDLCEGISKIGADGQKTQLVKQFFENYQGSKYLFALFLCVREADKRVYNLREKSFATILGKGCC